MSGQQWIIGGAILLMVAVASFVSRHAGTPPVADPLRAAESPLHYPPAIATAGDDQCVACHGAVLVDKPRGEQESFHRRHLVTPTARQVMNLRCNTCHQGRDAARHKQVDAATTCLKCHGQMPWGRMRLVGPWPETRQHYGNSCLASCHDRIRTRRHQVAYLKPDAIEAAGRKDADTCYGCHGGRAWYRVAYAYGRSFKP